MRIVAIILRILIIVVGFKMMSLSGREVNTAPFCSGIGFVLVGIYFAIQAVFGPKSTLCSIVHGLKYDAPCKK